MDWYYLRILKWEEMTSEAVEIIFYLPPTPQPDLFPQGLQGSGLAKSVSSEDSLVKQTWMAYMFSPRLIFLSTWESLPSGAAYKKALRLSPNDKSSHWGLGAAPEVQGRQKYFLKGGWGRVETWFTWRKVSETRPGRGSGIWTI